MELNDSQGIKDKVSIVLIGPDGKVKDKRSPEDIEAKSLIEATARALAEELEKLQEETNEERSHS